MTMHADSLLAELDFVVWGVSCFARGSFGHFYIYIHPHPNEVDSFRSASRSESVNPVLYKNYVPVMA